MCYLRALRKRGCRRFALLALKCRVTESALSATIYIATPSPRPRPGFEIRLWPHEVLDELKARDPSPYSDDGQDDASDNDNAYFLGKGVIGWEKGVGWVGLGVWRWGGRHCGCGGGSGSGGESLRMWDHPFERERKGRHLYEIMDLEIDCWK